MNQKIKNFALFAAVLAALLLVLEISMRLFWTDARILLSDASRKNKVHGMNDYVTSAVNSAGVRKETFNIYYFGESTMWGVPFGPDTIPRSVSYRLGDALEGRPVRSVNLSSAAKDASYSRYLLEFIFRKKEIFHPSLIVIYSGNNEFIKFHPTEPDFHSAVLKWLAAHSELARQLLTVICSSKGKVLEIDERQFFDTSIFPFDPKGYEKVEKRYQAHFLEMVKMTGENKVPFVISTVISNYESWEPNRSVFLEGGRHQKSKRKQFIAAFQKGRRAERQKHYDEALSAYEEALTIDNRFAEVHYRLGKVYEAMGEYEKAWGAFQKAIDDDGMPIRARSSQNDFIRSLERPGHVYIADSLAFLRSKSPNHLLDHHLIIDGIHPTLEGYVLVSEAIAEKINSLFGSDAKATLKAFDQDKAKSIFGIDNAKMFEVYTETGRWITRLATWRYDPAERLNLAEDCFRQAIRIAPERYEGFLGLSVTSLIKKDAAAASYLQKASAIDLKKVDEYLSTPWIRKIARRANLKMALPHGLPTS